MPVYGNYETVGNPHAETQGRNHLTTVWLARRADQAAAATFALRLYSPKHNGGDGSDTLAADQGLEFIKLLKQQKRAAEGQRDRFVPIHEMGPAPEGVWYATDYYTRGSLKNWITLRGNVDSAALRNVVAATLAGCRQMQAACGRSHGNLKPANIFLGGKAQPLGTTPLFLADPLPVASESLEARDLRGIGELVLQLVVGRIYQSAADYNYPVDPSRAWNDLGKEAEFWRDLCNRLIDPNLSLTQVNFESLARQFPLAKPASLPLGMIAIVAGVCVVGGALGVYFLRGDHSKWVEPPPTKIPPVTNSPPPPPAATNPTPIQATPPPVATADLDYTNELASANTALATNDFSGAISHADKALDLRPDDAAAFQVKTNATALQASAADARRIAQQQVEADQEFTNALNDAQTAFTAKDYPTAVVRAQEALDKHTNDPTAIQIKKEALSKQSEAKDKATKDIDYNAAMIAARADLAATNYAGAIDQARKAWDIRKGDTEATNLINEASSRQSNLNSKIQTDQVYTNAITTGLAELANNNYLSASNQASIALGLRPEDPTALQLQKDAAYRQKIQLDNQAYTNAITEANSFLQEKNYTNAIARADIALKLRELDDAATQIKKRAKLLQDEQAKAQLAAQKQAEADQAYTNVLKLAQSALDGKDYSNAIAQAGVALSYRTNDVAANELIAQATQQQKDARLAADAARVKFENDLAYTNFLTMAVNALKAKDYPTAVARAQNALAKRADDSEANRVKNEAQTQQAAAELAAKADTEYTNALNAATAALKLNDYQTALTNVAAALQLRQNDFAALQIQTNAFKLQADVVAATGLDYTNAFNNATNFYSAKDYQKALSEVGIALTKRVDDAPALALQKLIKEGVVNDQRFNELKAQAVAAVQAENYTNALDLYKQALAIRQGDSGVTQQIEKIKPQADNQLKAAAEVQNHDHQLQVLMRHFGVKGKKSSQITPDKIEPEYGITIDQAIVENEGKDREALEKWYTDNHLLTGDRKEYLDAIKKIIDNWGN